VQFLPFSRQDVPMSTPLANGVDEARVELLDGRTSGRAWRPNRISGLGTGAPLHLARGMLEEADSRRTMGGARTRGKSQKE
jgi:hypothetical protein